AKSYLKLQNDGHEFSQFVWQFVNHKTILNRRVSITEVPATTAESDAMSKALLKAGFKFVGSTICYAFMQATGMVNDHLVNCHRYPTT
ncbi:MAG: DNA-3-methyladenine glycosylase I, partial [Candidatus Methylopumilus sp.]|nr:DNA-3-methyladenine glycosylase I [Candidatus Methylopumilus sp.]